MEKLYIVAYDEKEYPTDTLYFATSNEQDKRVLTLTGSDLTCFKNSQSIIIINRFCDKLIIPDGDWITENRDKELCYSELCNLLYKVQDKKEKNLIAKIVRIFEMSLNTTDAVCIYYFNYKGVMSALDS